MANQKTSEYPDLDFAVLDDNGGYFDFSQIIDIVISPPSITYSSRRFDYFDLIDKMANNIYVNDGTLTGDRVVDAGGFNLTFQNAASFQLYGDSIYYEDTTGAEFYVGPGEIDIRTNTNNIFSVDNIYMLIKHGLRISINTPDTVFMNLGADTVPYLNSSKALRSSTVTPTELGYLSGAASNIQAQIDALTGGTSWKKYVRVATVSTLTSYTVSGSNQILTANANGALTIDGVSMALNDDVLVKDEGGMSSRNNGIYTVTDTGSVSTPWVLTRRADANTGTELVQATVSPREGTSADHIFICSNDGTITIGTDPISFVDVGGTSYVGTTNRVTITGNQIDIAATYVGQASITTLGTISTGTWQGTSIAVAYGGTGSTTASGARTNLGLVIGIDIPAYNDSRMTDVRGRKYVVADTITRSHTGDTSNIVVTAGLLIPGGSMGNTGRLQVEGQHGAVGTGGLKTFRYYLHTSPGTAGSAPPGGATFIGASQLTNTQLSNAFERRIVNKGAQNLNEVYPTGVFNTTDLTAQTAALTTLNIDTSVDLYLIVAVQNANAGDTGTVNNVLVYIDRQS